MDAEALGSGRRDDGDPRAPVNVNIEGILSPGDPRVQRQIGTTIVDALRSAGYVRNARFGAG